MAALLFAYGIRERAGRALHAAVRLASMGYAVPGTIMAVGVILPFAWIDNTVDSLMRRHFDISTGLLLSGTLAALLFAYTARFMAAALQSVESGLARIKTSMDSAARGLGCGPASALRRVHAPMLRGSLVAALILVFVDAMKELPATLILRPFDFNTLAVRTFELASDERLAEAGAPALLIVLTGMLPIFLLNRSLASRP
jgi:iron(III) transport system permease protein